MTTMQHDDVRIPAIMDQLKRFASGQFAQPISVGDRSGEIGAICEGLDELGRVLEARAQVSRERQARMDDLLDVLLRYSTLDFSKRATVGADGDELDALGAGLNALGEEVSYHTSQLRNSEEQIKTIFKNAPDAVVVIDAKGVVVRWNPAAARIFGWKEKEIEGKPMHEVLIPERFREKHVAGMRHFLATGEGPILNRTIEVPALCKNGSELDCEVTISPAKLDDGEYLFIAFLRDITERKKWEEQTRHLNMILEQRVQERTEELYSSEKKYKSLFENNPIPLWIVDIATLRYLDVNESAVKHYGYSREEFLSMSSVEIRPEEERERYINLHRKTLGTQNTGIWKHRKKDGTIIFSDITVHEITFEGKAARLVLANDVTEKTKALKALQNSEARFRRIFESRMMGLLFWDATGEISEANDFFLEMIGYTREDLRAGRLRWKDLTPPELLYLDEIALKQITETGVCEPFEKEYIRKDGVRFPVLLGAASLEDSEMEKGVAYVMDISQRKLMERQIMELNHDLEVRIDMRTQELQQVNKELESFTYSVSHDLRAPLRAIHGYSQMLSEDHAAVLDSEGQRLLEAVKYNAKKMGQLVDDLLAFSRLGKRAYHESYTNLDSLVNDILIEVSPLEKERTSIVVHPLGTARADTALMRQAFHNLISNAIKYSSKKERAEIEIGSTDVDGLTAFYVKDNGAGFDMAYYNKLFGVFQRLHEQEDFDGTGVGLAIVQRIIHRHGGRIWAEAKVDEGATFYFTLGEK